MNRHAKASSAGSTLHRAKGFGLSALLVAALSLLLLAPAAFAGKTPGGAPLLSFGPQGPGSCAASAFATGSGDLTSASKNVANVSAGCGAFEVGQTVEGSGVPAGTTISAVGAGTLTLSKAATATATATGAALSASWNFGGVGSVWLGFDQAGHRLYALEVSGKKIYAFNSPGLTGSIGGFPLSVTAGLNYHSTIAVDNTNSPSPTAGRLYFDDAGEGFTSSPSKLYAYTPAGVELTSPTQPNFPVTTTARACGSGVDPDGNVYVSQGETTGGASQYTGTVRKYSLSGGFLETVVDVFPDYQREGPGAGTYDEIPCDLAFDSNGDMYVAESGNGGHAGVWKYTASSGYSAASATQIVSGFTGSSNDLETVAVDAVRHLVYVVYNDKVSVYQTSGEFVNDFATGLSSGFRGIAVDESNGRVYVSDRIGRKIYAFGLVSTPAIGGIAVDSLTAGSATLHATVNPEAVAVTDCHFEYTSEAGYELHGFAGATSVACDTDPGSGSSPVAVAAGVTGLVSGTDYRARVVAGNANGTSTGEAVSFAPLGPKVRATEASAITDTGATLSAEIDPNGEATSYRFQYTTAADYELHGFAGASSIPAGPVGIGSGSAFVLASQTLGGLSPDSGYRYRVVATNPAATTDGPVTGFATWRPPTTSCPNPTFHTGVAAGLPDCRAYEQVSPVDKNGFDLDVEEAAAYATPDGGAVAYASQLGAFAESKGAYLYNSYAGRRLGGTWQTEGLTPPILPFNGGPLVNNAGMVAGVSPDLSKQLVVTNARLTADAVPHAVNLYVHDSDDDSYRWIVASPKYNGAFNNSFVALSNDGNRAFFAASTGGALFDSTPAPPSGLSGIPTYTFEWDGSGLNLVGILPNETVSHTSVGAALPVSSSGSGSETLWPTSRPVSADGSRIYWNDGPGGESRVYLREEGHSVLVSARASDGVAQKARFWYGTPAGVGFLTSAGKLTDDSSAAGEDLYRYDPDAAEPMTDLTPSPEPAGARVKTVLGTSEDGSYVYFVAEGDLAEGALAGSSNIYAWHEGQIRLVDTAYTGAAALRQDYQPDKNGFQPFWRVSPNGRYLGFLFGGRLRGPHPEPGRAFKSAYLYDYSGDTLACASCLPGGEEPSGDPILQVNRFPHVFGTAYTPLNDRIVGTSRNVSNKGQFFFDSPDALVPADSNGHVDVYEYENGEVHLISSGQSDNDSYFADAGVSGNDVFFATREGLVGQDTDPNIDLYDARVDGGIASQATSAQGAGCQGEACKGAPSAAPSGSGPGTSVFSGSGNPKPKHGKAHKKKRTHRKRHGRHHKHHAKRTAKHNRRASR